MLEFPASTIFGKAIPKAKFYEKLPVTPMVKRAFVNEIAQIVWRNKLSPETLNIRPGSRVKELEVIEIELKGEVFNEAVLKTIDRGIPYQLLFLLKRRNEYQACMGYKESEASAVKEYYRTEWLTPDELPLQISGLTLDEVCDNFIRQIHGELQPTDTGDLKTELTAAREREKLQKKIAQLENKLLHEKQFKKQLELRAEIQKLNAPLGALGDSF
ncbi:MAG: DUF4391 domain-containing protein [Lentisphaeria bacterium]|nr:DUF4391 domain-containing protein [Lentisphaeria bacterium]